VLAGSACAAPTRRRISFYFLMLCSAKRRSALRQSFYASLPKSLNVRFGPKADIALLDHLISAGE
jgi:hypothetical protein